MPKPLQTLLLPLVLALPLCAWAGPKADALGTCLADSTTGKERKELSRWIFIAMASHPEIRDLANLGGDTRERADKNAADLVTALLTERCKAQAREAVQQEGGTAMVAAFTKLGEVAMQEIMNNGEVAKAITGYERYIDRAKLTAAFADR